MANMLTSFGTYLKNLEISTDRINSSRERAWVGVIFDKLVFLVFSCEFGKFLITPFYRTPPGYCFWKKVQSNYFAFAYRLHCKLSFKIRET